MKKNSECFFKIRTYTIFLILYFPFSFYAQSLFKQYYNSINNAEKYFIEGKNSLADSCFNYAFNLDSIQGFNQDYLMAVANSFALHDSSLINKYLLKFAVRGGDYRMLKNKFVYNVFLEEFSLKVLNYINLKRNKILKSKLQFFLTCYKTTLNHSLIKKIKRIYFIDQNIARSFVLIFPNKYNLMEKIDKKNADKLLSLCKKYGWPGFNLIGEFKPYGKYSLNNLNVIIRHFSPEILKKLEPYVFTAIKSLNACPDDWAGALDYCSIKNPVYKSSLNAFEMKQIYGTLGNGSDNSGELIPFGKIEEVNEARKSLFLGSIEVYSKIRHQKLPSREVIIIPKKK